MTQAQEVPPKRPATTKEISLGALSMLLNFFKDILNQ